MEPSRDLVQRLTSKLFPAQPRAVMLGLLDQYGILPSEPERDRVQIAILKLSDSDPDKLAELVALAKRDYRDVLAAAEYPEQSRAGGRNTPPAEDLARIRQEDRRQYLDWLRGHLASL